METTQSGHLVTTWTLTEEELAAGENEYTQPLFFPDAIRTRNLAALQAHLAEYPASLYAEIPSSLDPFIIAAQQPDPAALRLLLDHWALYPLRGEPEPNERGGGAGGRREDDPDYAGRGDTLLNVACAAGAFETARYLLATEEAEQQQQQQQQPGRLHARSAHGATLILQAAGSFVECAQDEMRNGRGRAHVDAATRARIERSEALVDFLLDRGASARDTWDSLSEWDTRLGSPNNGDDDQVMATVLSLAIARAGPTLLQRLLDAGADALVTTTDSMHERNWKPLFPKTGRTSKVTLLHLAALYGNYQGIQVLLEHYAQKCGLGIADVVVWRDQYGRLPIHWAVAGWPGADTADTIVENGPGPGPGTDTDSDRNANNGNGTMAPLLRILTNSGNPHLTNARDQYGETPLHYAITPNLITGRSGLTAAHFLCKVLAGDVNAANDAGNTPLHLAAQNLSNVPAAKFLIGECGANVRIRNKKGQTPLHEAARGHFTSSMIDPVEERIRAQDAMLAVLCASVERELALDKNWNALMDEEDLEGKTPRQIAREMRAAWRHEEVERAREITWLRSRGRGRGRGRGG